MREVLVSLAVSLVLTLVLEMAFALLWGVEKPDWSLVVLVNVLTNPVVVLCYTICAMFMPAMILPVTLLLEFCAVAVEGLLYAKRSEIAYPWLFALCVNSFSFCVGLLL